MTVRQATEADIPAMVEMGRRFHAMSPHKGMGEYDAAAVGRVLAFMIVSPQSVVLTNGDGVIGGTLSPVYFNPAKWQLEENFWWAERGGQDLLAGLFDWGRERGASFLMMSTLENDRSDVIDRLMCRKGFVMLERRYMKEIA